MAGTAVAMKEFLKRLKQFRIKNRKPNETDAIINTNGNTFFGLRMSVSASIVKSPSTRSILFERAT
jgi:hypothetical protein